jgi:hypothetical protein
VGDAPISQTFAVYDELGITGIVVNEAGAPLRNILVRAGKESFEAIQARTREDGRFELRGLQAGTYEITAHGIMWSGPDHHHPELITVAEGAPAPEVRIVCPMRYSLEGQVLDEQGRPVVQAQVDISQSEDTGGEMEVREGGRFSFGGLLPGKAHLSVSCRGTRHVTILSGEADPVLPIDHAITFVISAPPEQRIEGRVIGGVSPREPTQVEVHSSQGEMLDRWLTDTDGHFSAVVRLDGECSLSVTTERGETAQADHVVADAHVDLQLRPPATLRGKVRGAPREFRIRLSGRRGREEVFVADDGSWEMRGVPAGETTVEALADGLSAEAEVTLAPGEVRALDLRLLPLDDAPSPAD